MKRNPGGMLLILGLTTLLGGCETIQSWFPDKQKQYKYSTEIPPLEVPPDLHSSTIEGAVNRGPSRTAEADAPRDIQESPVPEVASEPAPRRATRPKTAPESTLAASADQAPVIEIAAPFEIAWNDVSKALGRMELEITDQNHSDGVFFVYYGGNQKPYRDRGLLGDIADLFSGGWEKSQEFRVKLDSQGRTTALRVLDTNDQPQTTGLGFELLQRLHETLKSLASPDKGGTSDTP